MTSFVCIGCSRRWWASGSSTLRPWKPRSRKAAVARRFTRAQTTQPPTSSPLSSQSSNHSQGLSVHPPPGADVARRARRPSGDGLQHQRRHVLTASAPSQLEAVVIDPFRRWLGYPNTAGGVMTSGGSAAVLDMSTARSAATYTSAAVLTWTGLGIPSAFTRGSARPARIPNRRTVAWEACTDALSPQSKC